MTLHTVGHGRRTVDELVAVLRSAGLTRLVDVRRFPGSRRQPELAREALDPALAERGVAYEWWGESLGGRRSRAPQSRHPAWENDAFRAYADHMDTPSFRSALTTLLAEVADGPAAAVMCAETVWWRCHRRLIADAAVLAGTPVVHLLDERKHQPHPLHPQVRPGDDGWPVYDVGQQELL